MRGDTHWLRRVNEGRRRTTAHAFFADGTPVCPIVPREELTSGQWDPAELSQAGQPFWPYCKSCFEFVFP